MSSQVDRNSAPGLTHAGASGDPFAGAGEMRALMRAMDWSKTGLGPVERWPRSLRTMLGVVLGSRFPMLLWWGPELLHLYNDAYRPILRDKHPASLAAPAAEVWAEVWDVAGPMARSVQQGGPATWTEDLQLFINNGSMAEETYFTFSYSPVPGDDGEVGGVLNTVQETTTKVQAERQIHTLHDLSARAADAKSEAEALRLAREILSANELDLPFLLHYATTADGQHATLAGVNGWKWQDYDGPARPLDVPLSGGGLAAAWPFAEAMRTGREIVLDDLSGRFGPLPAGRWNGRPDGAVVLPLSRVGQATPYAFLVAGISPHRVFDERYRRFFQAAADQVRTVVANAGAYAAETKRAEALADLDEAKTAFFSNVSHEFRTPLTLMLGPTQDALDSPGQTLSAESLRLVHRNARRLLKLVNSLLDFSRIEAGRAQASYEPSDLAEMTAYLASAFRSAIERTGLTFSVDCESLPEPIYVDPTMWEKIVLNLLSNALKFTFEGSIGISLRWRDHHAELTVRDTGTGIPDAELPHLFERFHRVRGARARTHEGSGIGLALLRDLVRLHGGTVRVASQPGEGTAFTVSIPGGAAHLPPEHLVERRAVAWTAKESAPFIEEALRWSGGPTRDELGPAAPKAVPGVVDANVRILVVDDNADLREYICNLLESQYSVEAAVDGEAALEAARRRRPDLVVSDVMMPRLDGFGLVRAMRADPTLHNVPFILLSARAGEEATIEGLEAGADDYLIKPFAARELLARVRTHVELARQREVFERFFALSLDLMCIAGVDGYFKRVSPAFEILGYSREELLSRPFLELIHPDDRPATLAQVENLARGAPVIRFENRNLCKDGGYRWVSWTAAPAPSGTLYAIGRDVTDAKVAGEAVRRANQFLEAVIENIPDMVFVKEAINLAFVRFNSAGEALLGVPRDALLGKTDYDLFSVADADAFQAKDRETLQGRVTVQIPAEPLETTRGRRWLHTKKVPILGADGTPQFLLGISEDITDRRQADEARARLAAIVESSDDAIIGRSLDGLVTTWNKGAERVFGYAAEEVLGKPVPPAITAGRELESAQLVGRLERGEQVEHFTTLRKRKDGREIHVSANVSPILDAAGKVIGTASIARDITETMQTQAALARAKDAAEASNRELESFSYSVAHDLRAPLRSIDGFSQALLEDCGPTLDDKGRRYLGLVREAAQLMARLIDDMLSLSRVTRSELRREAVDLSALARAAHARLERSDPGRHPEMVIEDGLMAHGDPRLLAVVFDNLLGNAWKFTLKQATPRIEFGAIPGDVGPTYFVRDNGAGFDMTYASKLFGVFQRLHSAHEFEGTGVGLATVQRVVHRHGGRIWAEGKVGAGATFYFTIGEQERNA